MNQKERGSTDRQLILGPGQYFAPKPRCLAAPAPRAPASPKQAQLPPMDEGIQLQIKFPPPLKPLKKPMPAPILGKNEAFTFSNLMRIMEKGKYTTLSIRFVKDAYKFAEKLYSNKQRDDGTFSIVHPLAVAVRAAKMGLDQQAICAALLHDAIEDTNRKQGNPNRVLPEHIMNLFGSDPASLKCGKETLKLVLLLTKPKYLEKSKQWVFPQESSESKYFSIDDDYYSYKTRAHPTEAIEGKAQAPGPKPDMPGEKTPHIPQANLQQIHTETSLYDDRSDAYYSVLLNSGNIGAIVLKLLDNVHNAETTLGLEKSKVMKNLRTMSRNTMGLAGVFLVKEDVRYVTDIFLSLGIDIERSVTQAAPESPVHIFQLRDRFDIEELRKHPDPQYAYISVYGSKEVPAIFIMDEVEIGLPPRLGLEYYALLREYFQGEFVITPKPSRAPPTSPVHEMIFQVSGFTSREERFKVIRPSQEKPGYFEIPHGGTYSVNIPLSAFTQEKEEDRPCLGPPAERLIAETKQKYGWLEKVLVKFYQNEIYPVLEKHEVNQPSSMEKN